jgi:serine/threonine protein kinase
LKKSQSKSGSFGYAAPEISPNEMINTSRTDMWSLSVLMFLLFTEYLSYSEHPIEYPVINFPQEVEFILWKLLMIYPHKRASINEI